MLVRARRGEERRDGLRLSVAPLPGDGVLFGDALGSRRVRLRLADAIALLRNTARTAVAIVLSRLRRHAFYHTGTWASQEAVRGNSRQRIGLRLLVAPLPGCCGPVFGPPRLPLAYGYGLLKEWQWVRDHWCEAPSPAGRLRQ